MCLKCPLLTVTLAQWCSLLVENDISASCVSFGALDSGRQSYILKHSETQHSKRPVNAGLLQSGTNRVGSVFAKSRHVTWTSTGQEGVDYDDDVGDGDGDDGGYGDGNNHDDDDNNIVECDEGKVKTFTPESDFRFSQSQDETRQVMIMMMMMMKWKFC